MSIPYVYDAGVLLAIDNDDRRMWAVHHLALEAGRRLLVPAVVVAQGWRGARQVQLGRFLRGCEVVPVGLEVAKAAGVLCGRAGTRDVVDASVVSVALGHGAIVFTSDPQDIARLGAAAGSKPGLVVRRV